MKRCANIIILLLLTCMGSMRANVPQTPFHKGVNLSDWMMMVDTSGLLNFRIYTKQDFVNMKSLGCDVVRLPINLPYLTNGSPNYAIAPQLFQMLDSAVKWCEDLKIYLILDNHPSEKFFYTPDSIEPQLIKIWAQMAKHFVSKSDFVVYEVLNEPHSLSVTKWNTVLTNSLSAIRSIDTTHSIIVGGVNWDAYNTMSLLPKFTDKKLIYTFHYYNPMLFTHQGAAFVAPSLENLSKVPFPYDVNKMPVFDSVYGGSWVESAFDRYPVEGNPAFIVDQFKTIQSFQESRNVPLFCGEFGVLMTNCDETDRITWLKTVVNQLDSNKVSWTHWNYRGSSFGLYHPNSFLQFKSDINVPIAQSIGLNPPAQTPFSISPDNTGLLLYDDFVGEKISPTFPRKKVNFFANQVSPFNSYSIAWTNGLLGEKITLDFTINRDFSQLRLQDYYIHFQTKSTNPVSFDVRFIDSKESTTDHPWRMSTTVNNTYFPADNQWHHIQIPLSNFIEIGCWDEEWLAAQNLFSWTHIDKIEFVVTQKANENQLCFDNIYIAKKDEQMPSPPQPTEDPSSIITNPTTNCPDIKKNTKKFSIVNQTDSNFVSATRQLALGDSVVFGQVLPANAISIWRGPNAFHKDSAQSTIQNIKFKEFGTYIISSLIGGSCVILDTFYIVPRFVTQTLSLPKGVSFVSLYVRPSDSLIRHYLSGKNTTSVKTLSRFWRPELKSQMNSLNYFSGDECYVINMKRALSLSVYGIVMRPTMKKAEIKSWNVLGSPDQLTTSFSEAFSRTQSRVIKNFESTWYNTGTTNSTEFLQPGKAYFIRKD